MKRIVTLAALAALTLGIGLSAAEAGSSRSMQQQLLDLAGKLQSTDSTDTQQQAYSGTKASSMLSRLLGSLGQTTADAPTVEEPSATAPKTLYMLNQSAGQTVMKQTADNAGNRTFKLQSGKGHVANIKQHGVGNSAITLQAQ